MYIHRAVVYCINNVNLMMILQLNMCSSGRFVMQMVKKKKKKRLWHPEIAVVSKS